MPNLKFCPEPRALSAMMMTSGEVNGCSTEMMANLNVLQELMSASRKQSISAESELARLRSEATLRKPSTTGTCPT